MPELDEFGFMKKKPKFVKPKMPTMRNIGRKSALQT